MIPPLDRTTLNIVSAIVAGGGLFTVLTAFNVPEASRSFFGDNPFLIKRETIEQVMDWIFSLVAVLGLIIQLWAEIWGSQLPDRLYTDSSYVRVAIATTILVGVSVWGLSVVGRRIARRSWLPTIVDGQRELFKAATETVFNDGLTPAELDHTQSLPLDARERRRASNLADAEAQLSQIERLLEISHKDALTDRVERLRPFFEN